MKPKQPKRKDPKPNEVSGEVKETPQFPALNIIVHRTWIDESGIMMAEYSNK